MGWDGVGSGSSISPELARGTTQPDVHNFFGPSDPGTTDLEKRHFRSLVTSLRSEILLRSTGWPRFATWSSAGVTQRATLPASLSSET